MAHFFIGVDIAKSSFHAHILGEATASFEAKNTPAGFERIARRVPEGAQVFLALEATSTFHEALADWAVEQGWTVFVVNPAKLKHYVRSQSSTHKDDAIDARLIARYVSKHHEHLHAYRPLSKAQRQLRSLTRRRDQLKRMMTQESNREGHLTDLDELTRESHQRLQAALKEELVLVEAAMAKVCKEDKVLDGKRRRLESVPMIGKVIASVLLAEMGDEARFENAKQVTAWSGLVPLHQRSGSSLEKKGRISRAGNKRIRQLLYMAAMGAMRHAAWQPWIKARQKNGKNGKVLLVAIMDKMLRICWGLLKHEADFDPKIAFAA